MRTVTIPAFSLDEILKDHQGTTDFIRIDVEGGEMQVLRSFDIGRF